MDALSHIIALLGSQADIARALGLRRSAVNNWRRDGIPLGRRLELVELCRERGLPVNTELVLGKRLVNAVQHQLEAA